MPEYKLTYFNARGLGELSRWIMEYGSIPYTDNRVNGEQWATMKKDTPGGLLPVLYIDDKPLMQSGAIVRYLARETGLIAETNLEQSYCDALSLTVADIFVAAGKIRQSDLSAEEKKQKMKEEWFPTNVVPLMDKLNKKLEGKEWFIGNKMTWADMLLGNMFNSMKHHNAEVCDKHPVLKAHVEKICALPAIKAWIAKRPATEF